MATSFSLLCEYFHAPPNRLKWRVRSSFIGQAGMQFPVALSEGAQQQMDRTINKDMVEAYKGQKH